MRVLHYQRRQRTAGNHSLEFIFSDVRSRLTNRCNIGVRIAPCFSNGLINRIAILLGAWRAKADITHITGDINFAAIGVPTKRAIVTILDCGCVNLQPGFQRSLLKLFWLDWPVKHAKFVTTISQVIKREIIALTGCVEEKVVVIPVAISEQFRPSPAHFNSTSPTILHVGTAPNKNLSRVIEAIRGLKCTLVIIGQISSTVVMELDRNGVHFENYSALGDDEILAQYKRADLLCFPSTYEGFGMPILEAQAVGRPVVTSNVSSMPEVAGVAACFVDPLSAQSIRSGIMKVIEDELFRTQLVADGFENVKRFNAQAIAESYLDLYEKAMQSL